MKICALVDPMGSDRETPEQEYAVIKRFICNILSLNPEKQTFISEVFPYQLAIMSLDMYVIDYGGMMPGCEDTIRSHFRSLLEQIKDKPNTLFVLWSRFTFTWYKSIIEDYSPDFNAPNVAIALDDDGFDQIIKWFNVPEPTPKVVNPPIYGDEELN